MPKDVEIDLTFASPPNNVFAILGALAMAPPTKPPVSMDFSTLAPVAEAIRPLIPAFKTAFPTIGAAAP